MRALGGVVLIVVLALAIGGAAKVFWPKKYVKTTAPWLKDPIIDRQAVGANCAPTDPKWKCDPVVK